LLIIDGVDKDRMDGWTHRRPDGQTDPLARDSLTVKP